MSVIIIKSAPNSLVLLPVEEKIFEWDSDEYDYSEDALKHIELLMMQQRAFTVETDIAHNYDARRGDIVEGSLV